MSKRQKPIPQSAYDGNYFRRLRLSEEFKPDGLPKVFQDAINYASLTKSANVLDVGCGKGEIVLHLASKGIKSVGVDYSKAAIKIALDLKKATKTRLAEFSTSNCTSLPFVKDCFDCVFMIDLLEHLTPKQTLVALKEANRVLRKGGVLIVHTNNLWFEKIGVHLITLSYHNLNFFKHKYIDPEADLHINFLSKNNLKNLLLKSGFRARVELVVPKTLDDMKKYIPYDNRFKTFVLHRLGLLFLKSPMQYFLGSSLWAKAGKV